jgi:RNA polymerase sigma-70 factor (ECF subfamily)
MDPDRPSSHLSRISTPWSLLRQAHADSLASAETAQHLLLQRYCGAVFRHLQGALKEEEEALELLQEFALRFLRGDFRRADPGSGRFRDYLRKALSHLITDYYRERKTRPQALPSNIVERTASPEEEVDSEAFFLQSWREELINRTWEALAAAKPTYYAVLLFHVQNPDMPSPQVAAQLTDDLNKPLTAGQVRVILHRAREKFSDLLLDEVAHSLATYTEAELIQELRALHLLELCAPALQRRQSRF